MLLKIFWIFILVEYTQYCNAGQRLNEYVLHYESLDYDAQHVAQQHERSRRGAGEHAHIDISFHSHQRSFRMRLKRDTSVFHPELEIVGHHGEPLPVDTTHFYEGHLLDEPQSVVYGSVLDGVFDGEIHSLNGTFYVERANKYFPRIHRRRGFHSVIYKEEHVVDPYEEQRTGHVGRRGVTDDVAAWMDSIQHSASEDESRHKKAPHHHHSWKKSSQNSLFDHEPSETSHWSTNPEAANGERQRRSLPEPKTKSTCSLFIQTDPYLWKHFYEQEKRNAENTRKEITSLIARHVKTLNLIYMDTIFDGKYPHRMIRFEVQRIKIDDYEACQFSDRGEENKFCLPNIDISNLLDLHSQADHSDFCLSYLFTYRDLMGFVGNAWHAVPSGTSGGVCEPYRPFTIIVAGERRTTKRSLNTGVLSFVTYNNKLPPKVSQLALAHEIGHSFGSPNDYPAHCKPGGQDGNYLMSAVGLSGDRPNNWKFSTCSVANISLVLDAIYEGKKRNCFTDWNGAFCGNKIVEEGEECDCGYNDAECEEKCCYPRIVSEEDRKRDPNAQGCKRRPGAKCSPSEGPCCSKECTIIPIMSLHVCRKESECGSLIYCTGYMPGCLPSFNKPRGTLCDGKTKICQYGECSGSICLKWGMRECFLSSTAIDDKRKLCELACQPNTPNATCTGTSELTHITGFDSGIFLKPGSPCDNYKGYCDVFLKCRAVDPEGSMVRLKNLLFNKQTLNTVAEWITENWWAVLLMGVAFILVMCVFIKCCAVHTPSSNPGKPAALSFTQTLRNPYSTLRRKRRQPQGQELPSRSSQPVPTTPPGPARGHGEVRGHYSPPDPQFSGQKGRTGIYVLKHE